MHNFEYYAPTKVVFGRNTESETGKLIKELNCQKVLVHYGGGSVVRSGLLDRVYGALDAEGIPYVSLGGVVPNPRLSKVREGISLARQEGVDFILAVGGGSVIDSAKAIGYGMANEGDVWDFYARKRTASACLPIGAVLTIAAAGSEMSNSSVITNEAGWIKRGYSSNYCRCRFAVLNPELTCTLPDYQTQSGCVDIQTLRIISVSPDIPCQCIIHHCTGLFKNSDIFQWTKYLFLNHLNHIITYDFTIFKVYIYRIIFHRYYLHNLRKHNVHLTFKLTG